MFALNQDVDFRHQRHRICLVPGIRQLIVHRVLAFLFVPNIRFSELMRTAWNLVVVDFGLADNLFYAVFRVQADCSPNASNSDLGHWCGFRVANRFGAAERTVQYCRT